MIPKLIRTADKLRQKYDPIIKRIESDSIPLYAAQASFFTVISAIPFMSLLAALLTLLIPTDLEILYDIFAVPDWFTAIIGNMLDELRALPTVSLLSVSALTTLWTASRGTRAIRDGLATIYRAKRKGPWFLKYVASLLGTLNFLVMILALVVIMLFGSFLVEHLGLTFITEGILHLRIPFFIVLLTLVFCLMFFLTARRSEENKSSFLCHMPGAFFSAAGWLLFSFFYSLYVTYFPNASSIYGGLAAVCLIMLWFYFCIMILLLGGELNVYLLGRKKRTGQIMNDVKLKQRGDNK